MIEHSDSPPVLLVLGASDPTGGGGLQADAETALSMGCHPAPVLAAIAVRDTVELKEVIPVTPGDVVAQARAILEDLPVRAIKIGVLASIANAQAVHSILHDYAHLPVVFAPSYRNQAPAGAGEDLLESFISLICPLTTVLTVSTHDAHRLAPEADSLNARAQQIMSYGAQYVLATGAHDPTPQVVNTLFGNMDRIETFRWQRLDRSFHGAGCTLASAIGALLAHGTDPISAASEAQHYTHAALRAARRLGHGRFLPARLYWTTRVARGRH